MRDTELKWPLMEATFFQGSSQTMQQLHDGLAVMMLTLMTIIAGYVQDSGLKMGPSRAARRRKLLPGDTVSALQC